MTVKIGELSSVSAKNVYGAAPPVTVQVKETVSGSMPDVGLAVSVTSNGFGA